MAISEIEEIVEEEIDPKDDKKFKNFDIVTDFSDHSYYFLNRPNRPNNSKPTAAESDNNCFNRPSSDTYKKIMREWRILERDLPDTIYVRAYENHIDLLRAAIVGPAGTPYHDGLFFFDIAFPPEYPNKPPLVHYRSFGLRINPNLYKNGYVCLSLLNTWYSKQNCEIWNPTQSTILQVLVSIQAMVLNIEPFYNEPGREMEAGSEITPQRRKQSCRYNEKAFLRSCRSMVYLIDRPPNNFKDLVVSHFRNRAPQILAACNAYMKGRESVGGFLADGEGSGFDEKTSIEFQTEMIPEYRRLLGALAFAGDSVKSFADEFGREERERELMRVRVMEMGANSKKKTKKKVWFWNRIKGFFGLKTKGEKKSFA